ncbi:MAG: class I SAM-dependent methyltransferase [Anaerolineales bacterium]|nr:class I SAM-dependent methyltransferase [Anaerolineales bacterium]
MPEELRSCPLCGHERSNTLDQREHLGRPVTNRLCARCGLVFQSPRMTAAEAQVHYAAEYRRIIQGREAPIAKDLDFQTRRADWLVGFLRRKVGRLECHLDIGCSAGILLQRTREAFGVQTVGVEPGQAYREYGRGQGLEVHAALETVEATGQRFDLVSLIHVLEHLPDPAATLAGLRQKQLTPDGWLLVEVPNVYIHTSFEYEHLFSFSRRTLTEMLGKAGFRVAAVRVQGRPLSQMLPFYITVLARPQKLSRRPFRPRPERFVAGRRRLGWLFKKIVTRKLPRRWWLLMTIESYAQEGQ